MWVTDKLENLCEIEYGTRVVRKKEQGTAYPVYGGGEETFRIDRKNRTSRVVIARFAMSKKCTRFIDGDFFLNDSGLTLSPKNDELSQEFLNKIIFLLNDKIYSIGRGAAQRNLNMDAFKKLKISYPTLAEQERIVAKLDAAFERIDHAMTVAKNQLIQAPSLLTQYLANISALLVPLEEIINIKTGKLNANAMEKDGIYPFFTCSREIFKINTFAFDCDAVLLAGNNAAGDFNVKHYKGKFNAYQRTYVLTVKDESNLRSRYLYFQLINALDKFKKLSVGAGTKFLKLGMIKEMKIPLPSISEQDSVLKELDILQTNSDSLLNTLNRKLIQLEALKSSMLSYELKNHQINAT